MSITWVCLLDWKGVEPLTNVVKSLSGTGRRDNLFLPQGQLFQATWQPARQETIALPASIHLTMWATMICCLVWRYILSSASQAFVAFHPFVQSVWVNSLNFLGAGTILS